MTTTRDETPNDALAELLGRADRPGDFFASGVVTTPLPLVQVAGVGTLSFPLHDVQAAHLVAVAERAPYGRGEDTLVDTDVRRTWQIDAASVSVGGAIWPATLDQVLAAATAGLGVSGDVHAELYKLLLYDAGSFFVEHRDSEKADGMFATLVIVLPSLFTGGELVVRHRDAEITLPLQTGDLSQVAFAAFYADCRHEVRPVSAGKRLALVYNLLRTSDVQPLGAQQLGGVVAEAAALLARWRDAADWPTKLVYPLAHEYTLSGLTFERLKGKDDAAARTLTAAAAQAECVLYLTTLAIEESGSAEHVYTGRRSRWDDSDDAFEITEVHERSETLTHWRAAAGTDAPPFDRLPYEAWEVSPLGALEGVEPDEVHFTEATGNEGASFEQSYRRAALVLWPRARHLEIIAQSGTGAALAHLAQLAVASEQATGDERARVRADAFTLSRAVIDRWHGADTHLLHRGHTHLATLLDLATRLGDTAAIARVVGETLHAPHIYDASQNAAIASALGALDDTTASEAVTRLIGAHLSDTPDDTADLLIRLTAGPRAVAHAAVRVAVAEFPAVGRPRPGEPAWRRPKRPTSALLRDLLTAVLRVQDDELLGRSVDHVLASVDLFPLDAVLLPAVRELATRVPGDALTAPGVQALIARCLGHIGERSGPIAPPSDWTRPFTSRCKCVHTQALARFMADPTRQTWVYPVAEAHRNHLSGELGGCDAIATTVKRGSPYHLVVTKNDASYRRLLAQREADMAAFEQLAPLLVT